MLAKKIVGSGRQAIARPQAPPLRWFARRRPAPEATPRGAHLPLGKPARLAQGGGQAGGAPRCKSIAGTQLAVAGEVDRHHADRRARKRSSPPRRWCLALTASAPSHTFPAGRGTQANRAATAGSSPAPSTNPASGSALPPAGIAVIRSAVFCQGRGSSGARSSAVEHYLDMVGVTGSIPVAPTSQPATERHRVMKVRNSLKSLRGRHRGNRLVRRKGRVYIINKTNRRFKARQG